MLTYSSFDKELDCEITFKGNIAARNSYCVVEKIFLTLSCLRVMTTVMRTVEQYSGCIRDAVIRKFIEFVGPWGGEDGDFKDRVVLHLK